jgi:hypothetical protein
MVGLIIFTSHLMLFSLDTMQESRGSLGSRPCPASCFQHQQIPLQFCGLLPLEVGILVTPHSYGQATNGSAMLVVSG